MRKDNKKVIQKKQIFIFGFCCYSLRPNEKKNQKRRKKNSRIAPLTYISIKFPCFQKLNTYNKMINEKNNEMTLTLYVYLTVRRK